MAAKKTRKKAQRKAPTGGRGAAGARGKAVRSYGHPGARSKLRPDVGTQQRFRNRKPPQRYHYDSSLSPALHWDGQNHARELGEWLLHCIEQASALQAPHEFKKPRCFKGAGRQLEVRGLQDAVRELKNLGKPFLNWAGRAERLSFDVPTLPLFVHERLSTQAILQTLGGHRRNAAQGDMFGDPQRPIHEQVLRAYAWGDWQNRLVLGDSLVVMNSLLHYEGLGEKVQMIYVDPPYGIRFGSNFQPFVRRRDVRHNDDDHMTREPETVKAYRDTWELGLHSYLTYMRDRLLLARQLLHRTGSIFVQISDENLHHVREVADDVFGEENFAALICFVKTTGAGAPVDLKGIAATTDYLLWYARDIGEMKYRPLYLPKEFGGEGASSYTQVELADGTRRALTKEERSAPERLPEDSRIFAYDNLTSQSGGEKSRFPVEFEGREYRPRRGAWRTNQEGMKNLKAARRIGIAGNAPGYILYLDDFPIRQINNLWKDTGASFMANKTYVVQTTPKVIQRCILMTTDPGDLVFDPTCGGGTTAYVAEQWGRRWITCDTSRVAITLAKQRLSTAVFDYYKLAHPDQGVSSGFQYKTVPHITLKSIANDEPPATETLYDQPLKDTKKARVTGPFTVEAVPAPMVKSIASLSANAPAPPPQPADASIARSGETLRQSDWRGELLKTGIRGKRGQRISFSRVEPLPARWLHANAETAPDARGGDRVREPATAWKPQRAVISFGPEHAPLEQRQVENALQEADHLRPKPQIIIFAAFQFDPEAAKDIEATTWHGMTMLKAHMNADMQTTDLKKQRASNESFWLIGQPDVDLRPLPTSPRGAASAGGSESADGADGTHAAPAAQWQVEIKGFDYFNTKTGQLESGDASQIALWMLDPDYDGRHLTPQQVFFPLSGPKDGWSRLARTLRAEIDESLIQSYHSSTSLPFTPGPNRRVAIKITDDRGVETLRVLDIPTDTGT